MIRSRPDITRMTTATMRLLGLATISVLLAPVAARAQAEEVVFYHTDAVGSVRMITSETGVVIARYDYLPFGEPWPDPPTVAEVRQFAGKERDETKLDYFGARYYASRMGRFTTVDPGHVAGSVFDPQSWNAYSYALNNPFRFVDLFGFAPCPAPTDTSTCVEGRLGTGDVALDLARWWLEGWIRSEVNRAWNNVKDAWNNVPPPNGVYGGMPGPPFGGLAGGLLGGGSRRLVGPVSQKLVFDEAASATRHVPGIARGRISAGPINGQAALDLSVRISSKAPRRVGIDYSSGQFVILDQHGLSGLFHGHVRSWASLEPSARAALIRAGMADGRGRILWGR